MGLANREFSWGLSWQPGSSLGAGNPSSFGAGKSSLREKTRGRSALPKGLKQTSLQQASLAERCLIPKDFSSIGEIHKETIISCELQSDSLKLSKLLSKLSYKSLLSHPFKHSSRGWKISLCCCRANWVTELAVNKMPPCKALVASFGCC